MTITPTFSKNDIYLLGNLGSIAVMKGFGEQALPILKFVQDVRPKNAGAYLLQAMYLYSIGEFGEGITFLEASPIFEADINRDEAIAFHLYLLQQDKQYERVVSLAEIYLEEDLITSESAHHTIRTVLSESIQLQEQEQLAGTAGPSL